MTAIMSIVHFAQTLSTLFTTLECHLRGRRIPTAQSPHQYVRLFKAHECDGYKTVIIDEQHFPSY